MELVAHVAFYDWEKTAYRKYFAAYRLSIDPTSGSAKNPGVTEKGKPVEKQGRKVTGLKGSALRQRDRQIEHSQVVRRLCLLIPSPHQPDNPAGLILKSKFQQWEASK